MPLLAILASYNGLSSNLRQVISCSSDSLPSLRFGDMNIRGIEMEIVEYIVIDEYSLKRVYLKITYLDEEENFTQIGSCQIKFSW